MKIVAPNVKLCVLCILFAACLGGAYAEDLKPSSRVVNRSGWAFPGQQSIIGKTPKSKRQVNLNGATVEVETFADLPVWSSRNRHYLVSKVVIAFVAGDSVILDERELATNEVTRYSVGNRPFLFTMLAYPCSEDPHTKVGGCAGADIRLAYYDEDGDGRFEVMELINSIVSPYPPQNWHPRIPHWAAALATSR